MTEQRYSARVPGETADSRGTHAPALAAIATLAVTAICWVVVVRQLPQMGAMDMGLGPLPSFLGAWVVMMAAMMLPSAIPFVSAFAGTYHPGREWPLATGVLVAAYLLVWAGFGVAAFLVYNALRMPWPSQAVLAGFAIILAGAYGLVPFKRACQARCRAMCHVAGPEKRGIFAAAPARGFLYGVNCVGCSAGVMVAFLVLGMSNLALIVIASAIVFLYKVTPLGNRLQYAIALALVAVGVWFTAAPPAVPALI